MDKSLQRGLGAAVAAVWLLLVGALFAPEHWRADPGWVTGLVAGVLGAMTVAIFARRWHGNGDPGPTVPAHAAMIKPLPAVIEGGAQSRGVGPRDVASIAREDATDREFLPAALELLETPPSPINMAALWLICVGFVTALAFLWFGKLDIHAVAQGRIQPSGRSKVIQSLEPGRVVAIAIENGRTVSEGDVLLELDPTETGADREAQERDLESMSAEVARRRLAVTTVRAGSFAATVIPLPEFVRAPVRNRENEALTSELGQLAAAVGSLDAQIDERDATIKKLTLSIQARAKLLALTGERVDMRSDLTSRGSLSRALVIDSLQQHETQMITQVTEQGQLIETEAALKSLQKKRSETLANFIADQTQKLGDAERKADRLTQELVKAKSKHDRTAIRAPIGGTVQQLAVTTVGQVVSSGQALLTIVPEDSQIEIEAQITNLDIGFVKAGQPAVIKVEAFPFTRYGTLDGSVVRISRDAVDEREANALTDPNGSVKPQSGAAPPNRGQNLVFPATIALKRRSLAIDGNEVPLSPGMAVTVEILTGERRAIDYILAPLREITSKSARER